MALATNDPTDIVTTVRILLEGSVKYSDQAAKYRAKGVDAATKSYAASMKERANVAKSLLQHQAALNGNDADVSRAAIQATVDAAKARMDNLTKIEKEESGLLHSWYEKARGESLGTDGTLNTQAFWSNLIGSIIEPGQITRENMYIPWFVQNLESRIASGDIADWRKMKAELGDETYGKLEHFWEVSEQAKQSMVAERATLEDLQNQARGLAQIDREKYRGDYDAALTKYNAVVTKAVKQVTADRTVEDLAEEATHLYDTTAYDMATARSAESYDAAMKLLAAMGGGASASGSSSLGNEKFDPDRWAPWRGELVMDPKFRKWAAERGFENLGEATLDSRGRTVAYIRGTDDMRAMREYGRALKNVTVSPQGLEAKAIALTTPTPYASVRTGTYTDETGETNRVVAVNRGGKQVVFDIDSNGRPIPLDSVGSLDVKWAGPLQAYEQTKDVTDDQEIARMVAEADTSGALSAAEAKVEPTSSSAAPTAQWLIQYGEVPKTQTDAAHQVIKIGKVDRTEPGKPAEWTYFVRKGNDWTQTPNQPAKYVQDPRSDDPMVLAPTATVKDAADVYKIVLNDAASATSGATPSVLLPSRADYDKAVAAGPAKAVDKVESKAADKAADKAPSVAATPAPPASTAPVATTAPSPSTSVVATTSATTPSGTPKWTKIDADATPRSQVVLGHDQGTQARSNKRYIQLPDGTTREVTDADTVQTLEAPDVEPVRTTLAERLLQNKARKFGTTAAIRAEGTRSESPENLEHTTRASKESEAAEDRAEAKTEAASNASYNAAKQAAADEEARNAEVQKSLRTVSGVAGPANVEKLKTAAELPVKQAEADLATHLDPVTGVKSEQVPFADAPSEARLKEARERLRAVQLLEVERETVLAEARAARKAAEDAGTKFQGGAYRKKLEELEVKIDGHEAVLDTSYDKEVKYITRPHGPTQSAAITPTPKPGSQPLNNTRPITPALMAPSVMGPKQQAAVAQQVAQPGTVTMGRGHELNKMVQPLAPRVVAPKVQALDATSAPAHTSTQPVTPQTLPGAILPSAAVPARQLAQMDEGEPAGFMAARERKRKLNELQLSPAVRAPAKKGTPVELTAPK